MSDHTILATPPSNLDEDELSDALVVAPPSARATRVTRVLAALLLVAVGATGATWWAQRDGGCEALTCQFSGTRTEVREQAVRLALSGTLKRVMAATLMA